MTLMEEENLTWNPNRELCGGGLANIMSGLIGGYPVGGSFSRTSINKFAGSTSSWSGMITGAVVLSMLWLTPLLSPLPQAALGAIIIVAVIRLLKFKEIWHTYQQKPIQGAVAIATMVATIVFAPRVERGIVFGASLGLLVNYIERKQEATDDED